MPRLRTPLADGLLPAVFSRAEAAAVGITDERLRAPDLRLVVRGFHARAGTEILERDIVAALTKNDPRVAACGPTASRLWGFPQRAGASAWTFKDPASRIHLTNSSVRRRSTKKLRWRNLDLTASDLVEVGGARLTSRVRTWLDLAATLSTDDLTMIGDYLVRKPRGMFEGRSAPHATLEQLQQAALHHRGRSALRLRRSLEDIRIGSDSPAETRLRLGVLRAGLPAPVLNTAIRDDGIWLGEPDLSWPEWKVCVEHEGPTHLTKAQQAEDIQRTELRNEEGWIEVRTVAKDLQNSCARGVERIATALRRHGWRG